ncbi:MAG: alpha/beta hydrolase [Hyphomicrobiales bacterium]
MSPGSDTSAPLSHQAFRKRQKSAELDGLSYKPLRVAWTDLGEGEPVILLHGIPTWSFLYNDVIGPISQHARVIAPDFLGHGYSDKRDFFDRSLLAQTAMIVRLMDHLGIAKADFVGHDTGGGVSLIMAIHHPERVRRLILTNVVAYDSWPIDDMIALGNPNWRSKAPEEVAEFLASGLPDGLFNQDRLTPAFREGIVAPYSDEEGKISIIRNASALNTNHTTMLVEKHGDISAPTLCLWGVHDPWQTIRDGERLAQEIPNARLVRVENASHWIPHDTPQRFAEEVSRFVAES